MNMPEYAINCSSAPVVNGQALGMGLQRRRDPLGSHCPIFEERFREQIIPMQEWAAVLEEFKPTDRPDVKSIWNQLREGSCAGFSCAQGQCVTAAGQGLEYPQLSPISLYKRTGRSPSSGSTLSDNVREARDTGVLPYTGERDKLVVMGINPQHVMPMTGFYEPFPSGDWKETAKYFRLGEYYDIRSIEGFGSALLTGWVVYYGRSGHAIVAVELTKYRNEWHFLYANSWGAQWGDQGFGLDSVSFVRNAIRSYGCFAFRTVVVTDELLKLAA